MKRTYSQAEKDKALAVCAELGSYQASRRLGIPQGTLANWMVKAGVASVAAAKMQKAQEARAARIEAKRTALRERLLDEAHYCMDAIHNEHIDFKSAGPAGPVEVTFPVAPAAAVQHYATSLAIFIDKFRLENGEVTGREEVVTVDAVDAAIRELEAELARRGAIDRGSEV